MKRKVLSSILVIIVAMPLIWLCGYCENHYNCDGRITKVEQNTITVEDIRGMVWEFEDNENHYKKYDNVRIEFDMNGTTNYIKDDIIKSVKTLRK